MSNGPARAKQERDCDECSRKQVEIARVYRGHRYCRTCYTREFKHRACPGCGETARLPRESPKAVCRKCERGEALRALRAADGKDGHENPLRAGLCRLRPVLPGGRALRGLRSALEAP